MHAMNPSALALNRFGLGVRPGEPQADAPRRWLLEQFERYPARPAPWADQPGTGALVARFVEEQQAIRNAAADQKLAAQQMRLRDARQTYIAAVGARATAALSTPAPFVEHLVHFWANHFAVSIDKLPVIGLAGAFEADAIRPHVLGRFEDMLVAVARHPAMLLYLDQANSIGPQSVAARRIAERGARQRGLNENLAREILELHTVGVRSGYTQSDVTEFARALTGWSIAGGPGAPGGLMKAATRDAATASEGYQYRPAIHEPGARTILGRSYGEAGDGEGQARDVLHDLAAAPATARHIAFKLARHFIADDPPPAAVQRLSTAFQRSGGDLPAVHRVLIESPEAWNAPPTKFKTPWEWAVSALRALGRTEVAGMQMAGLMNQLGQPVWRPGSPAGFDDIAASWAAPDALLRRVELAQRLAAQAGGNLDARSLAPQLLPGALGESTTESIARADSPAAGLALLLVSPEFLRR
jgi:uncharacterized protein (DUF1800 family)